MKRIVAPLLIFAFVAVCAVYAKSNANVDNRAQEAALSQAIAQKIKIFIVAGHDNEVWGTQYNGTKEVELNRMLASDLYNFLKADPLFEPTVNQRNGAHIPELVAFFERKKEIEAFRKERRDTFKKELAKALEDEKEDVHTDAVKHNRVSSSVANRLYGTNMWANERDFDAVINIHFNDYPGRPKKSAGKYSGFVIYTPSPDLQNSESSRPLAEAIYSELAKHEPKSNLPVEKPGIIESSDLIALGARNSLNAPAVLIEYAYIAEPRLQGDSREGVIRDMAFETYTALKEFYGKK